MTREALNYGVIVLVFSLKHHFVNLELEDLLVLVLTSFSLVN